MAYKDEYEVARLYTDGSFADKLSDEVRRRLPLEIPSRAAAVRAARQGDRPPAEEGIWRLDACHAFRLLARLKFLRGTAFDPFGYTAERKAERQLIEDYEAMLRQRLAALQSRDLPTLIRLARIPEMIRAMDSLRTRASRKHHSNARVFSPIWITIASPLQQNKFDGNGDLPERRRPIQLIYRLYCL